MQHSPINEFLNERAIFAEGLFRNSVDYNRSLNQWLELNNIIEETLNEKGLRLEILKLEDLFQELILGAVTYGYMTGYQDANYQYTESSYLRLIEQWNKDYIKPNK